MSDYVKTIRFIASTMAVLWLIWLPCSLIYSYVTEPRFEPQILGSYENNPHFRIRNGSDQIVYVVAVQELPWLIAAVGDLTDEKISDTFISPLGFWALIVGTLLILVVAKKYFEYSLIGMFVFQNNKFYNRANDVETENT